MKMGIFLMRENFIENINYSNTILIDLESSYSIEKIVNKDILLFEIFKIH